MSAQDTIAAVATPPGRGGVAIVRISGPEAENVALALCHLNSPQPRRAYFRRFECEGEVLDEGLAIFFKGPLSYTGEDVLELQGHAGLIAPQRVLKAVLSLPGVRMAQPGEFTQRAFLNGKLDLTAAEAVEDLISAGTEGAARAALSSLQGLFAHRIEELNEELTQFRVRIEACLDFPEEHEDFFDTGVARENLQHLEAIYTELLAKTRQGVRLTQGARVVLSGAPNAGKSSLLNALCGREQAIVTPIPGTTRDVLSAEIELLGVPLTLTDTAGLREKPADPIEAIGIERAIDKLKDADLALYLIDGSAEILSAPEALQRLANLGLEKQQIALVITKADLKTCSATAKLLEQSPLNAYDQIKSSTKTQGGLDALRDYLQSKLDIMPHEGLCTARIRQLEALQNSYTELKEAISLLEYGDLVLCAGRVRAAQDHLGKITGKISSDDILGKIFSTFCIGK